jgi:hypothetical protein
VNYAVEQRLRLIDFLLERYGHVNRATIADFFGTGMATASRDFKMYGDISPNNMTLNQSDKTYYKTTAFISVFGQRKLSNGNQNRN